MAYYGGDQKRYAEMAIPIILVILVALVVGVKVFGLNIPVISDIMGGGKATHTLIITNEQDLESAKQFATDISSRVTKITPVVDPNVVQHLKPGYITSNNYDLVILYGDNTALTYDARKEITAYVNNGGSLLIVKGAGLKGLNADGTPSEYIFGWDVDDLATIIKFSPDCPTLTECNDVNAITVTPDQMHDVTLTPVQWEHPMIERIGLNAPLSIDITKYPNFKGIVRVVDSENKKVAWIDWYDADGKPHSAPAIIGYNAGVTGGRIVYLAYNPLELNQEDLFRNVIMWVTKET
ncbi:MAG: hypothetical protein J7K68_02100 [Candidatus Diapherotrites archaeon]|nr:hypothetical protein [Candidatus Diapherotrites archaeon]